jgi:phospholipase/carboxylesterase
MHRYNRRQFLGVAAAGTGAFAAACLDVPAPRVFTHTDALITVRPVEPTLPPVAGYTALGITTPRDGFLYVPTTYDPTVPAPLLMLLHGNGDSADFWETSMHIGEQMDDLGVVIVAPDSRNASWDIIAENGYRADPYFFNFALEHAFKRCKINPSRIAIAGFSDGGMEALGVGVANGDLFTHVMSYSAGALAAPWQQGKPKVFVSHGQADPILSWENARDNIVQRLIDASYDTTFVSFAGGHSIPPAIARQSVEWFLA